MMINSTLNGGTKKEQDALLKAVANLRKKAESQRTSKLEFWEDLKTFEETNCWRITGVSFSVFILNELGIRLGTSGYREYCIARRLFSVEELIAVGNRATKVLVSLVSAQPEDRQEDLYKNIYPIIAMKVSSFVAKHGHHPSSGAQATITKQAASGFITLPNDERSNQKKEAHEEMVRGLQVIFTLADAGSPIEAIARGTLESVGLKVPKKGPLEKGSKSPTVSPH